MSDIRCLIAVEDETGNVFGRGPVPFETSSDAQPGDQDDALPRSNIYDRDASLPWFSLSNPCVNLAFRSDNNLIADCGVIGTGTNHEMNGVTTLVGNGAWIVDVTNGDSQVVKVHQDVLVSPDELLRFEAFQREGLGGAGFSIQNLANGQWLVASGSGLDHDIDGVEFFYSARAVTAWQDANPVGYGMYTFSDPAASYTVDFQVGSQIQCKGQRKVLLRIYLYSPPPGEGGTRSVYDSFYRVQLVPAVSFGAVCGHNIQGAVTCMLQASGGYAPGNLWRDLADEFSMTKTTLAQSDDFQWQDVIELPIDQPSFYGAVDTPIFPRYVRIFFPGTTYEYASTGEAFVGHPLTLPVGPQPGWSEPEEVKQLRQVTDSGMDYVYVITGVSQKGLDVEFMPFDNSNRGKEALDEIRWGIWQRSLGGAYPVWVVLDDTEDSVVFGRCEMTFTPRRENPNSQKVQMNVTPLPTYVVGL